MQFAKRGVADPPCGESGKGLIMKIIRLMAGATAVAFAAPASASTVVESACVSVTDAAGCLFTGNINSNAGGPNGYLSAQNAYNAVRNPDITLNVIASTDDANFGDFGSFTGAGSASGTWTLAGYDVVYVAVKACRGFVLFAVSGSTGGWDTFDIPFNQNPHELSHLVFFGSLAAAVPEPSAWALMILGFGVAGAAMRQRKARVRFA